MGAFPDRLRVAASGFLDFLYPPRCAVCGAWDAPAICEACAAAFHPLPDPACDRCGRPLDTGNVCSSCVSAQAAWGGWAFGQARAAGIFVGPLRHAIHCLKYRGYRELGPLLGEYLSNRCLVDALWPTLLEYDGILPVPGEPSRERRRGYNPPELVARPLADASRIRLIPSGAVRRLPGGTPQMGRSPAERRRAAGQIRFAVDGSGGFSGGRILMIDDVFTTGATLHALASALRGAGATQVDALALAAGG